MGERAAERMQVGDESLRKAHIVAPETSVLVYGLFVVSRHRNGLLAGQTPEDAAITALNTSGRAVLLAGRMRRTTGAVRPPAVNAGWCGGDCHDRGRPDHAGLADPPAGHARLPRFQASQWGVGDSHRIRCRPWDS